MISVTDGRVCIRATHQYDPKSRRPDWRLAHIIVDEQNVASLRVARAVGATESQRWVNEHGRTMIRHVLSLR